MTTIDKTTIDTPVLLRHGSDAHDRWYLAHRFSFLVSGAETGGRFSIIDGVAAKGFEPPMHIHDQEDELYYVLSGTFRFTVGEQHVEAGAGQLVFLPRGVPHAFTVDQTGARALMLFSPAGIERYFLDNSRPVPATPPPATMADVDIERLATTLVPFGARFLPPPQHDPNRQ
jgi:quercetin dioxygenase-like cupin family protein